MHYLISHAVRHAKASMLALVLGAGALAAQTPAPAAYVDSAGILRWTATGKELALLGVNYTAPFAYAYRAHEYVGADRKASIDMDVAHLARLRVDAYRVHVWDRQISDRDGNLLDNEHLDLFDYLIARLEERGISLVITPIVWGGPGYPEPDPPSPGFSNRWSKGAMTLDTVARRVQQNYLRQFLAHVNRYNRKSYLDDPGIIGIELFNEPDHPGKPAQVTEFINALATTAREAGWRKPIFYNFAQGWSPSHGRAVCAAEIQGITFQWYPTGLVRGSEARGNMLPNVDRYTMPADSTPECKGKARLVYEFDAADVMGSYMYPAMARSFRAAGMQWVTQFAYDPAAIAPFNTEYQTHYLNLLYTPRKAISLLVAGEAFRRLPRGGEYGTYPASARFGQFRVSYEEELSEMNAPDAFYSSNNTSDRPVAPARLEHVAGVGTSPLVSYEGTGAYFLDRLEPGVWRLELYPDAVPLADPFGRNPYDRPVTRLVRRQWPMRISLPDLGAGFSIRAVDADHDFQATASGGTFAARPGVYVLTRAGVSSDRWTGETRFATGPLGEFRLPTSRAVPDEPSWVLHQPATEATAGRPYVVRATVLTDPRDSTVLLRWRAAGSEPGSAPMHPVRGYAWEASIPADQLSPGGLEYSIVVGSGAAARSFPAAAAPPPQRQGPPGADAAQGGPRGVAVVAAPIDSVWRVPVVDAMAPIVLFDGARDRNRILWPHPWSYVRFTTSFVPGDSGSAQALAVDVQGLAPAPHEFSARAFLGDENRTRLAGATGFNAVRIRARARGTGEDTITVSLVERNGTAWGTRVGLAADWRDTVVPLSALRRQPLALLPRPYPQFLPEHLAPGTTAGGPGVADLDGIQVTVGGASYVPGAPDRPHGFELERIQLERR